MKIMWKAPMMEEIDVTLTAGGWTREKEEGYRGQNGGQVIVTPPTPPTQDDDDDSEGYSQS